MGTWKNIGCFKNEKVFLFKEIVSSALFKDGWEGLLLFYDVYLEIYKLYFGIDFVKKRVMFGEKGSYVWVERVLFQWILNVLSFRVGIH